MEQRFGFCTLTLLALTTHHYDFCLDFFFLWIFFKLKFWVTHGVCWSRWVSCAEKDQCKFMGWYLDGLIFTCNMISSVWITVCKSLTTENIKSLGLFKKWKFWDLFLRVGYGIGHPNTNGLFFRGPYFKNFTLSILLTISKGIYNTLPAFSNISKHQVHQIFIKEQTSDGGS